MTLKLIFGKVKQNKRILICRINENGREIWEDLYISGVKQKYIGLPYIEFELIETHLRYPERKSDQLISQQIGGNFADLVFQNPIEENFIIEEDMKFWFNEPVGGWRQGIARYYFLEEIPMQCLCWPKMPKIFDGLLRKPFQDFNEGDVIDGICDSIHLNHGICIDFGCTFLGLIPMTAPEWERLNSNLAPEMIEKLRPDFTKFKSAEKSMLIKCKIRRKMDAKYFRWPLELDVIEPRWLKEYVIPIGDYEPRLNVVDEEFSKIDGEEYARISGRRFNSPRRYAYHFADRSENFSWRQSQIDYFPGDHSQDRKIE